MTRTELEAAIRTEFDRLKIAPQESKFQHWLDSIYEGRSVDYDFNKIRKLAGSFRRDYCTSTGSYRRGNLPVATEDS